MTPELKQRIDSLVQKNKIMVFMKGNKLMPQCGFSNNVVQIINTLGVPFETFDVLADQEIRQGIKEYSYSVFPHPRNSRLSKGARDTLEFSHRDIKKR